MKKRKKTNNYLIFILGGIFVFVAILFLLQKKQTNQPQSHIISNIDYVKHFNSKSMHFEVNIPNNFNIKDDDTYLDLFMGDKKINITRIGTNFNSVEEYVQDFDNKRKLVVVNEIKNILDGKNVLIRIEKFDFGPIDEQKVYYIYVPNWVYSLSTSSPVLYDDLDKIAQSFHYIPH